jgi:hypothetical protein
MRAQIAGIRREIAAASDQRTEVAELFEKRELQLANVAADVNGFAIIMLSSRESVIYISIFYSKGGKTDAKIER